MYLLNFCKRGKYLTHISNYCLGYQGNQGPQYSFNTSGTLQRAWGSVRSHWPLHVKQSNCVCEGDVPQWFYKYISSYFSNSKTRARMSS